MKFFVATITGVTIDKEILMYWSKKYIED